MSTDILHTLLDSLWSVLLIVIFFGGSIFVHEYGHFLAARRRGVHVERFSIGFGPKIFSWRGKDGVEYRLSWLPLGGYVLLPQLADLGAVEGAPSTDTAKLPPVAYGTKMIVFVAGAVFNLLFAFVLACILWVAGQPTTNEMDTTQIGVVSPTLTLGSGATIPNPAIADGLEPGDIVRAVNGKTVQNWADFQQTLWSSSGRDAAGQPEVLLSIDRAGRLLRLKVHPLLAGTDALRSLGLAPRQEFFVHAPQPDSVAAQIGIRAGDQILAFDHTRLYSLDAFKAYLTAHQNEAIQVHLLRDGGPLTLVIPPRPHAKDPSILGIFLSSGFKFEHQSPFAQMRDNIVMTFRVLGGLLSPKSDIGLSKLTGPIGISSVFYQAALSDFPLRLVIWFTILINVNLAIFNLLPIPVLDGGQMLFATIGRLRGRALPGNFVATAQSVFIVLFLSLFVYISFFDVRRIVRTNRDADAEAAPAAAAPAKTAAPPALPAAAKP